MPLRELFSASRPIPGGGIGDFALPVSARKYSPDQPRVPAGNPEGGQWTDSETNVGITSSRPGHIEPGTIAAEGEAFAQELRRIPGVQQVAYGPAHGAWTNEAGQLESETSWHISYDGNGEALERIRQTARDNKQELVVVWQRTTHEDPAAVFRHRFKISEALDARAVAHIHAAAQEARLPGWTINVARGLIDTGPIPQWGDPNQHYQQALDFGARLRALFPSVQHGIQPTRVRLIERSNDYQIGAPNEEPRRAAA